VLERDGHACRFCEIGDDAHRDEHGRGLHVHHIIPERDGGPDVPENLITVCGSCHRTLEHTHAQAVSQLDGAPDHASEDTQAKAGATFGVRKSWATADAVDAELAEFANGHPTFCHEFGVFDENGDGAPPCIESRRLKEMVGDATSEWAFLVNWGYKRGLIAAAGFIEGWAPEAVDGDALEDSDLPAPESDI
jgi:hypothetical protein